MLPHVLSVGAAESCDDLYDRGNRQDGDYELQVNGTWVSVYCQFGDPAQNQHHYIVSIVLLMCFEIIKISS